MYEVDDKDRVVTLEGIPQSSVGAPEPVIIANEHRVVVAYRVQSAEIWDGKTVRIEDPEIQRGKNPSRSFVLNAVHTCLVLRTTKPSMGIR
jgi:hypothetical protein